MKIGIGTVGLIVIAMMLVIMPNTVAEPSRDITGQLEYANGTPCWLGITTYAENLNETIAGEPWYTPSFEDQGYIFWDYLITAQASSEEYYVRAFAYTQDEKWYGETTHKLADVRNDSVGTHYIFDIVLSEVPVETETFTKFLPLGWNLISLPLTPTDNSVSVVLNSISGNYDAVKSYNAVTHQFEDATTMDPGVGYFVNVTAAGTWEYEGDAYTSMAVSLSQGLNMVGWTNISADLPGALSSINGNYNYVAHWNATSQSYEVYEPNAPAVFNDFVTMERGKGYFIAATSSCTLTYP